MNKGEIWCLNKIKSGLLVMTDNLTIKVQHETNGRIYTKIPDQHPLSGRHRFRFGSGRWTVYRNRLVWMIIHKEPIHPEFVVDHKDGNRLNDQPDNLQLMPKSESHQQGNSIQTSDVFDSLCRWFDFVGMHGREPVTEEETLFVETGF
jgi:hypothetical protein